MFVVNGSPISHPTQSASASFTFSIMVFLRCSHFGNNISLRSSNDIAIWMESKALPLSIISKVAEQFDKVIAFKAMSVIVNACSVVLHSSLLADFSFGILPSIFSLILTSRQAACIFRNSDQSIRFSTCPFALSVVITRTNRPSFLSLLVLQSLPLY